jgi:hypothetical protein
MNQNNIFGQLSEQAFVLQSIEGILPNVFVSRMIDFFYDITQLNNLNLNQEQYVLINGSASDYIQIMYEYYIENIFDEERTMSVTQRFILALNTL